MPDLHQNERQGRISAARNLLRGSSVATLATSVRDEPHAALVTPAWTSDLTPTLLLSNLSRHAQHLRDNHACTLLCVAEPVGGAGLHNPQTRSRISLLCHARLDHDPALRACYLAMHPYAALYADFGDFNFWRLSIRSAQFVQGFARAWSISTDDLLPPVRQSLALQTAGAEVVSHFTAHHADGIGALGSAFSGIDDAWRLVGVDVDGCDLVAASGRARVSWLQPVEDAEDLRRAIMGLIEKARCRS